MRWFNSQLKSSLLAILGFPATTHELREDRIEHIRQLLLDELGEFGHVHYPKVVRHVLYATDAQALWFVRSEVLMVLGALHGEHIARKKITCISIQFKGLLPKGLTSRSSSLTP